MRVLAISPTSRSKDTVSELPSALWAHGIVGQRMFIEPLFTEDANVKNELDLPRTEFLTFPDGSFRTFGASFERNLYPDLLDLPLLPL